MKQYLLMCDENGYEQLKSLFKPESIQFLEVQGMNMQGGNVNVLVTPILPPVTPMAPIPAAQMQAAAATPPNPETQVDGTLG